MRQCPSRYLVRILERTSEVSNYIDEEADGSGPRKALALIQNPVTREGKLEGGGSGYS